MQVDGFLGVLKPPGMTSQDVVAWVRRVWGVRRAGHLGTLDPAAAGVLPIALGRATRLFRFAAGTRKAYRAEIVFGCRTDTLDAEGRIIEETDAGHLTEKEIEAQLASFVGERDQAPPAFSAAKVEGRSLHRYARAGELRQGRSKRIVLEALDLVSFEPGPRARALVDVVCSGGTYIRVLADELGTAVGPGACLGFLVRTQVGRFTLDDARTLEEIAAADHQGEMEHLILPVDWPLARLPEIALEARAATAFVRGSCAQTDMADSWPVRVYSPGRSFLGLGQVASRCLRPRVVLSSEGGD